ncbi:nucleotide exchange factor GrpE [Alicyclobacillus cycloheptanicus]|uniref:Protein GrpE n=1 Tax=Alicyclobacillus cycloheptanicus TaxID=1457 RepID=A0ABT9XJV2_9BACL|nr:nucleotide exchange factor GrpE [Alicyclobacillus cycloheptanicus]MDQ0190487.1 molecular chaperone GrpE [Alicyclobacillus cycloheptanicus]WDM00750.1 nucleotide exchange factor GrpE [Alicyclobacillus cycloheptanicus]
MATQRRNDSAQDSQTTSSSEPAEEARVSGQSSEAGDSAGAAASAAAAAGAQTETQASDSAAADDGARAAATDAAASGPAGEAEAEAQAEEGQPDPRDAEIDSLKQQLLRLQADFDNFRRRTRQEREELQLFATRKLLGELLPIADNFDRALSAFTPEADLETVRAGVEMVQRQLLNLLQSYDVTQMETVGQPFDPNVHEAVMQEPAGDREAGIVVEEFQKGYRIGDRVLRPAMVKVTV